MSQSGACHIKHLISRQKARVRAKLNQVKRRPGGKAIPKHGGSLSSIKADDSSEFYQLIKIQRTSSQSKGEQSSPWFQGT